MLQLHKLCVMIEYTLKTHRCVHRNHWSFAICVAVKCFSVWSDHRYGSNVHLIVSFCLLFEEILEKLHEFILNVLIRCCGFFFLQWFASPDYDLFGPYVEHRKNHAEQLFYILHPSYLWQLWDLIQSNTQEKIQPNPPSSGFIGQYRRVHRNSSGDCVVSGCVLSWKSHRYSACSWRKLGLLLNARFWFFQYSCNCACTLGVSYSKFGTTFISNGELN